MAARKTQKQADRLQEELMLQMNQQLYEHGLVPKDLYEKAKVRIVAHTY